MPRSSKFPDKYGPYCVITGASSGIGEEFARQLAAGGLNLVLVARRKPRLDAIAAALCAEYSVETMVIEADLATDAGWRSVVAATEDLDVGLLVNNAGVEHIGSFFHDSVDFHMKLIALNVTTVCALTHVFGKRLVIRGRGGGIINVSSMLSQPVPWMASYCASKAYVTNLTLIVGAELATYGIDVLCAEPGSVKSEMSDRALDTVHSQEVPMPTKEAVEDLLAMLSKTHLRTPGFLNRVKMAILSWIPREFLLRWYTPSVASSINAELLDAKG